jgi:hypothetical protein
MQSLLPGPGLGDAGVSAAILILINQFGGCQVDHGDGRTRRHNDHSGTFRRAALGNAADAISAGRRAVTQSPLRRQVA